MPDKTNASLIAKTVQLLVTLGIGAATYVGYHRITNTAGPIPLGPLAIDNVLEQAVHVGKSTKADMDEFQVQGGLEKTSIWRGFRVSSMRTAHHPSGLLGFVELTLYKSGMLAKVASSAALRSAMTAECGADWKVRTDMNVVSLEQKNPVTGVHCSTLETKGKGIDEVVVVMAKQEETPVAAASTSPPQSERKQQADGPNFSGNSGTQNPPGDALPPAQQLAGTTSDAALEAGMLNALKPSPNGSRQERAGQAIRAYKEAGVLPFRPTRSDYTDHYTVTKPTKFMGHDLVIVSEAYMTKYIGCCVDPGAGMYVKIAADTARMQSFARANRCRFEEFADHKVLLDAAPVKADLALGRYASLLCHESDEVDTKPVVAVQQPTAAPAPAAPRQVVVNAGATVCVDMHNMNKALAIARANNPYLDLPDGCLVVQRAMPTKVLRDHSPIPGVVVIQAGSTAVMVQSADLSHR